MPAKTKINQKRPQVDLPPGIPNDIFILHQSNLKSNANKFYFLRYWGRPGTESGVAQIAHARLTGEVKDIPTAYRMLRENPDSFPKFVVYSVVSMSWREKETLARSKLAKGYEHFTFAEKKDIQVVPVSPQNSLAVIPGIDPQVKALVDWLKSQTYKALQTFNHSIDVDALSPQQISKARSVVQKLVPYATLYSRHSQYGANVSIPYNAPDMDSMVDLSEQFFRALPRDLGRKIDVQQAVNNLLLEIATGQVENHINQLESMLTQTITMPGTSQIQYGGITRN